MKTLELNQMEILEGGFSWGKCLLASGGGALVGFASGTGNGVAFVLGPVGVTWGALAAIGGAMVGASEGCFWLINYLNFLSIFLERKFKNIKYNNMVNKKLFKVGLFGTGLALVLFSVKDSIGSKILSGLAMIVFIYMMLNGYKYLKEK